MASPFQNQNHSVVPISRIVLHPQGITKQGACKAKVLRNGIEN
jgi:hypothetical protein